MTVAIVIMPTLRYRLCVTELWKTDEVHTLTKFYLFNLLNQVLTSFKLVHISFLKLLCFMCWYVCVSAPNAIKNQ